MANPSVPDLVRELQRLALLDASQVDELTRSQSTLPADPRLFCRELIRREWLTPYQVNQLLQGRSQGLRLGSYLILERLGEAPIGEIFKARHLVMRRMVVLQVIRAELLAKRGAVERFYAEIQAVSQLSHRHLVAAYDAGPVGRTHFFATEHVDGTDLQTLLERSGPLSVADSCTWIEQASQGLQHAWERGLLHHDLRPANLLLVRSTAVSVPSFIKVRNLGLTVLQQETRRGQLSKSAVQLADYLAPEVTSRAQLVDVRSSLYSLGCTFYHLLAGRAPSPLALSPAGERGSGEGAQATAGHSAVEPILIETLRPDVPEGVSRLIRRLMARDPAERPHAPGEVAVALAELSSVTSWRTAVDATKLPPRAKSSQVLRRAFADPGWRKGVIATGLLFLTGLVLFGYLLLRPSVPPSSSQGTLPTEPARPVLLPPVLVVECGRGAGQQQDELATPGYSAALTQGHVFDGWEGALKRYCWYHPEQLRFQITVPPRTAGVLRLFCLDGDSQARKEKIHVQGRLIAEIDGFAAPGRNVEVALSEEDTKSGKIEVLIENLNPGINAVVSTIEFRPLATREKR